MLLRVLSMNCIRCKSELPVEVGVNDLCPHCGLFGIKSFFLVAISAIFALCFYYPLKMIWEEVVK